MSRSAVEVALAEVTARLRGESSELTAFRGLSADERGRLLDLLTADSEIAGSNADAVLAWAEEESRRRGGGRG